MKFKIDENLPVECAELLRDAGFTADTVQDEAISGTEDVDLLGYCRSAGRTLVTLDLDFGDVRSYPPQWHSGILVLRPNSQDKNSFLLLVERLIPTLRDRSPQRQLWIVEPHRVRYRQS